MKKLKQLLGVAIGFILLSSCSVQRNATTQISQIKFLDEYVIPFKTMFENTTVGGLSGIDYDKNQNIFYVISDDRSNINPARFYRFSFDISQNKIHQFKIIGVDTLRQLNGEEYPNKSVKSTIVPDPESIRFYPPKNELVWSSEGERIINENGNNILNNPSVNVANSKGQLLYSLPIPKQFVMSENETGPRRNGVFEGMSFSPDYKFLFVSTEEPLYEDGSRATVNSGKYWCRIIKYDFEKKIPVAQFAYPLDKITKKPIPRSGFAVNGISEILCVSENTLIVVERSFSFGYLNNDIRLYVVDLSNAQNIMNVASLKELAPQKPLKKKLLINLKSIGKKIDNIEGITFGPQLANGNRSLLLISDNNFLRLQKTQILLFDAGKNW